MKKLWIIVGVLMVFASFVTAFMANYFLMFWVNAPSGSSRYEGTIFGFLCLAIVAFVASGFCFVGGLLTLMNKYSIISRMGLYALLVSGLAPIYLILFPFILGVPMLSFFLPLYFLIRLSKSKLPTITTINRLAGITLLVSGVITVYSGLMTLNNLTDQSFLFMVNVRGLSVFGVDYLGVSYFVVAGFCLIGGLLLFAKRFFKISLLSAIFLMSSGFAAFFLYTVNGWDCWVEVLFFGFPQLFLSLVSLILLKIRNLQNVLNEQYTIYKKIQ